MTTNANYKYIIIGTGKNSKPECSDSQTINYNRNDLGVLLEDCSCIGDCITGLPVGCPAVLCCDAVIDTYLRSNNFNNCTELDKCYPKARIVAGCLIDDYGTIGGIEVPFVCGQYGTLTEDHVVDAQKVDNNDGTCYLKIDILVRNGPNICGPYGVEALTINWFFESP